MWGDNQGGSWDVHTIQTAWRAVCGGTSREDPGMSIQSRQHGGLCVGGHPGRILGCPYNPDSMRAACGGTSREDPGMSLGSSRQHGHLQATLDSPCISTESGK